ncbi:MULTISPECIES: 16S rRNA (guanine(527)-N(7))-methyltransferase RsmG [Terrabacteria group]|uniref:16S rRNA (guanine(527)-N(7))-methyltransferase RsmG n=1 Tax=Bacillati TaxID=1783272 RepID=UPI0019395BF9|nr:MULTISPECIES: 16S rRNA (guanine(527)-N(7))-methyltransferase RsmG [Terrabacteria group]MBW9212489.1 16S rRNA (guanine(527)-N(7))-methyltransferase RsmG [Trueperella sp. zg.1013]QRG86755.1 16S rRNA (guanine(527)-N(7))-methyltransferase RsmG [Bulleidia sp. zg-1006]
MNYQELSQNCQTIGLDCPIVAFQQYSSFLREWNERMNLTAIVEEEQIIEKHFWDCILPLKNKLIQGRWADVGSGAGFPGLVWKIMKPELEMTLIEPTGKRCQFLQYVIDELHLEKIKVVNERAEDYVKNHREEFAGVTARAVSNLSLLSELCVPLIQVHGYFLALKGKQGRQELEVAKHALDVLDVQLIEKQEETIGQNEKRVNLLFQKKQITNKKYPRNYGQMKKKPL